MKGLLKSGYILLVLTVVSFLASVGFAVWFWVGCTFRTKMRM